MARKIKSEPSRFKRQERNKNRRQINYRPKRKFYMIVCEGQKTEPNYFEAMRNDALQKGGVEVKIIGVGYNTESLVHEAVGLRAKFEAECEKKVDKLWVVFDKDSFTKEVFTKAIQLCENESNKNEKRETRAAWSNEAFELWYLLHFEYYETALSRHDYAGKIENNICKNDFPSFRYTKSESNMYKWLTKYGDVVHAIKRGKKLEKSYGSSRDYANQNPCTTVYKLVAELLGLENLLTEN